MSDFKFRFGTYGSDNALYASVRTERPVSAKDFSLATAVTTVGVTNPEHVTNTTGTATSLAQSSSGAYVFEKYGSITYDPPKIVYTCPSGFTNTIKSYNTVNISCDFEVYITDGRTFRVSVGTMYLRAYFINKDGKEELKAVSSSWHANVSEHKDIPAGKGTLNISIDNSDNYLGENTLSRIKIVYTSGTLDKITLSNLKVTGSTGGDIVMIPKTVKVVDKDGNTVDAYLCPWELKHIESISVTISGQTSTMGIPNKPASRTQIFDTGGAVRTIKVNGKRYDNEEAVSNWDFIYTQFNVAYDSEYIGKEYTYIGISWLLSTIQVLLRGYTFNIRSSGMADFRYSFDTNPRMEDCIVVDKFADLPKDSIFTGLYGYAKDTKGYYRYDGSAWQTFTFKDDTGYNVALTGFNSTFSESQPGLLEYSLTLTERFKNGDNIYNPYDPLTE